MSFILLFDSYRNHVMYTVVYVSILFVNIKSLVEKIDKSKNKNNNDDNDVNDNDVSNVFLLSPSTLGCISLVLLSTACLYYELIFVKQRWKLPPGDSGLPIFGDFFELLQVGPLELNIRRRRLYGSPVTGNMLMQVGLICSEDEDILWLIQQERKGHVIAETLPHWKRLFGHESIICQNTMSHKRLRKIFEPAFSPKAIQNYVQLLDDTTMDVMEKWYTSTSIHNRDDKTDDNNNDSKAYCETKEWAFLAIKLFIVCAFPGKVTDELLGKLSQLFRTWLNGFTAAIPFSVPGLSYHKALVAKQQLADLLQSMVDEFKADNPPDSKVGKNSLMGRLCYGVDDDGKTLTDGQLSENLSFLLFAGHDTSKGSFCAFVHYLKENPHVHQLLEEEVQTFSEPLDVSELKAAPILNAFLAEVWRLVPPLDAHVIKTTKELHYKDYIIPKNVICTMDIQVHNMTNESRYPDPTSFRIERWLSKDHPLHNPKYYAEGIDYNVMTIKYRTFNVGPHMCLGAHFAKLEARVVVTRLVQHYHFELFNDHLQAFPLRQYVNDFKLTKKGTKQKKKE